MNSFRRIEKRTGYKISQELKIEISSLYGENFSNDKDDDIVKLIDEHYTLRASKEFEFSKYYIAKLSICLILLNIASYFIIGTIYTSLFYGMELTTHVLFSTLVDFLYALVLIIIIAMSIFYYFFKHYEQHNEDKLNILKFRKTLRLNIIYTIILSIFIMIYNLALSPTIPWGFIILVGVLNSIWGELLGNYHYITNK